MKKAIKEVFSYLRKYPILIVILAVGWLVNLSFFFPIKGNIGHDVYWHLALIEVAFKTIPFQMPILSGVPLQGYNYLSDLLMYGITRLGIPALYVYYIVVPLIYVSLLSFLVILFGIRQNKSIYYIAPLTFFIFLASPFSYLLSWYKRGNPFFGFNYPVAMQSSTALTNLSYALTVPIFFIVFLIFQTKKRTIAQSILLGLLIALAFGFKFYGGAVLLCLVGVHESILFLKKRNVAHFIAFIVSGAFFTGLAILLFYNPFSSSSKGGVFGYAPFAIPNNLIEDPDGLYIRQFVLARYYILSLHKFSIRLVAIEAITVCIYLVYNFGTRIIGLFYLAKQFIKKKVSAFEWSLGAAIIVSILLTITLVQRGGDWWNTVQFFGYGLLLFNFFVASAFYDLFRSSKKAGIILAVIAVIMTMPLNAELVVRAAQRLDAPYDISQQEMDALAFLKKQKNNGAVFAVPVNPSFPYVPARSGKPVFFASENIISNLGIDYSERKKIVEDIKDLNINTLPVAYFYLTKDDKDFDVIYSKILQSKNMKKIYENAKVVIFEKDN